MGAQFVAALFGSDIGAYSLARSFYESYGVVSHVFGKYPTGPCMDSTIVRYTVDPGIETGGSVRRHLFGLAEHADMPVVALGVGDGYVRLLSSCKDDAPPHVVIPYLDAAALDAWMCKERFYRLCDAHGVRHPATLVWHCGEEGPATLPFPYPVVLKPSHSASYFAHAFEGQRKVYFIEDETRLVQTVAAIRSAGYGEGLVVQEYIPGADDCMHVLTGYADTAGRVRALCVGHVLLEEHTPLGIGNPALIVTEENDELARTAVRLVEEAGFKGFFNIDVRYDARTGTYHFLELNARQGRSNYYTVPAGVCLVEHLVEDVVNHCPLPYTQGAPGCVWSVIPKWVAWRYAADHGREARASRWVNPLFFGKDLRPGRFARLVKNHVRQYGNYRRFYGMSGGEWR